MLKDKYKHVSVLQALKFSNKTVWHQFELDTVPWLY